MVYMHNGEFHMSTMHLIHLCSVTGKRSIGPWGTYVISLKIKIHLPQININTYASSKAIGFHINIWLQLAATKLKNSVYEYFLISYYSSTDFLKFYTEKIMCLIVAQILSYDESYHTCQ
jgi:hypothetical protein